MSLPVIPLPNFLLNWYPNLQKIHESSAIMTAFAFGFVGLFIIALWATANPSDEAFFGGTARDRMRAGYGFLGVAILSCIFGAYLSAIFFLVILVYMIYAMIITAKASFFQVR